MDYSNILVTGGCGFLGTSIIKTLVKCNSIDTIKVIDNFVTGKPKDLAMIGEFRKLSAENCANSKGLILVEGDIRDTNKVLCCAQNVDLIIHLAANTGVGPSVEEPRLDMECNVIGTFNVLEAARHQGVKKVIFASSGAPAGEVEPPIHEELPPHPVAPYGASKLAGEAYCSAYFKTFGIQTVCLRFGNVYGPGSKKKNSVVAKFIRQALAGEVCVIYGDGKQTRDFIYIDDLVKAVILAMNKDVGGEIFQIATGTERTVGEVVELIERALKQRGIKMTIINDRPRLGDVKRNFADNTKAKKVLGWQPEMNLELGIERTLESFFAAGNIHKDEKELW